MHKKHDADEGNGRKIPINEAIHDAVKPEEEVPGIASHDGAADLSAELEKAKAEAREHQDKFLRLYADTENFKKRMNRESLEREKYYNEGIIKELLPVLDNLDRALGHAGEPEGSGGLTEGVRMVRKQLMDVLAKSGVTQVESIGLPFDPQRQQAVMQVETADYDEGTVVEELQKGYFLNDRILRPAMVAVAKRPEEKSAE